MMRDLLVCLGISLLVSATAEGQPSGDRIVVSVNAGVQASGRSVSDHFEFERNVETARVDLRYPLDPGVLVDAGVGFRLWKRLGAGVSVSHFTHDGSAHVEGQIPHQFQFNQPRAISGEATKLTRTETGVHLQILFTVASSSRVRVVVSGGPSRLALAQELATEVQYDESYPYDTATFKSVTTRKAKASKIGFNAGADVTWMFTGHLGAGGLVRFTRSTRDLEVPGDSRRIRVEAGGVQGAAGLRVMF